MQQNDIWVALPGVKGGRAVRDKHGEDYLQSIARKGGETTVKRYGTAYMRALGRKGGIAKRNRIYTLPKTIKAWDGVVYRRVPWYPHHKSRQRRKRPVLVRIEFD